MTPLPTAPVDRSARVNCVRLSPSPKRNLPPESKKSVHSDSARDMSRPHPNSEMHHQRPERSAANSRPLLLLLLAAVQFRSSGATGAAAAPAASCQR